MNISATLGFPILGEATDVLGIIPISNLNQLDRDSQNFLILNTTPLQEMTMREFLKNFDGKNDYKAFSNNCGHLVQKALYHQGIISDDSLTMIPNMLIDSIIHDIETKLELGNALSKVLLAEYPEKFDSIILGKANNTVELLELLNISKPKLE